MHSIGMKKQYSQNYSQNMTESYPVLSITDSSSPWANAHVTIVTYLLVIS